MEKGWGDREQFREDSAKGDRQLLLSGFKIKKWGRALGGTRGGLKGQ